MAIFLDTSALAKLYHREAGSEMVERICARAGGGFISRLGIVEMHSVPALKVRTGYIDSAEAEIVGKKFRADIVRGRFRVGTVFVRHYEAAQRLLGKYGASQGLRTLDSIQLASALEMYQNGFVHSIITADRVFCRVAPLEGLAAVNPEVQGS